MIHPEVLSLIGRTPLVEVNRLNPRPGVKILAKLESFNPGGSIKDRVALAMVEAAERSGELTPDKTIIEATSGNTGIGLAMVCAVKGYRLRLLMPDSASEERRRIMRAYGADIQLTPGRLGTDGAIEEAYRLVREDPDRYVLMDQFNNPASIEAHYRGTAQEIWDQTDGTVTHVVAALGTSGTVMGLAKRLKELSPSVVVAALEPYAGHKIQGLKNMQESYPPGIYDKHALDLILRVEDEQAFETARRLAREEGLLVGMSSGGAMAAALKLVQEVPEGSTIVVIFPDSGERYLSTTLFAQPAEQGLGLMDSVTGRKVILTPGGAPLTIYTMGPSLDALDDAEAWRRIVLLDALGRYYGGKGISVKLGVGLADLDDRTLARARENGVLRRDLAEKALDLVRERAEALGIGPGVEFFLASASLEPMFATVRRLLSKGMAYERLRSVYFDVERDKNYGMFHMDPDKLSIGKTVDLGDYVKENPRDFTLLKRATLQDLKRGDFLATEWGNVRPSWLLQHACAAVDRLGSVSVVLAGQTHRFPHLDNLRAIWSFSGAAAPKAWMISQPAMAMGSAQAHQAGSTASLADPAVAGLPARAVRLWLLSTSYRKPLACSEQSLAMWTRNWRKIQDVATALKLVASVRQEVGDEVRQAIFDLKKGFAESFEDDLGLHHFWPVMFEFCRKVNRLLSGGGITGGEAAAILEQLEDLDGVLCVLAGTQDGALSPAAPADWPEAVRALVEAREAARKSREFARADGLRSEIEGAGFRVEDSPAGPRLYRLDARSA